IVLRDGDHWVIAGHEGAMPGNVGMRVSLTRETSPGRAMLDARTSHFPNIAELDPVEFAASHDFSRRQGFRAAVTAPMLREGDAIQEARTIQYPDISLLDPQKHALTLERAQEYGFRASIAAPLLIEGLAIGAIVLRKPDPGSLAPRQVELLESFAAQAVIAIQ